MKSVPVGVGVLEEGAASVLPVVLCIGNAGNGEVFGGTANGPASLSDPDVLALGGADGGVESVVEESGRVLDGVYVKELEVRVGVHGDKVNGVDDGGVGAICPGVPGVDMGDFGIGSGGAGKESTNLGNVADEDVGASTDTGRVHDTDGAIAVEILASDGDGLNQVGELGAVGLDSGAEGGELIVEVCLTSRSPHSQKKGGVCVDGGGDGGDDSIGSTGLDGGVETSTGETRGTGQRLCSVEKIGEALLGDGGAIGV